ncbi:M-phase inducer phosphatase-like [Ylistrum balloti]|uniref:M-phase inducer phosphatase-like n=1 Tax=Ylistrum balloti TaxID=509963 RepID=UPI002905DA64|nr:M-phase inducer phosphatase-like [Ylistrum balloti]
MDFSDNSFGFRPMAVLKFGDDEEVMDLSEILTPRAKDSPLPRAKSVPPPILDDEDSGLGMEFDEFQENKKLSIQNETPCQLQTPNTKQSYSVRRSLFEKSKRLFDGDDDGSITKKPRQSQRQITSSSRALTKSLSFGDQPFENSSRDVISAVERLVEEENLTGNGETTYILPTIPGKHSDLKSITPKIMADVLEGRYDDVINSYRIIDCRYPYEYEGGHIKNAENLFTRDHIQDILRSRKCEEGERHILIFHCEFSSERGPKMSRFLRSQDREMNTCRYPFLNFPEVYLLHDGYKSFYQSHKEFCQPMSYKPMLHENHADDLRHFRSKSKSWCAGSKKRRSQRLAF